MHIGAYDWMGPGGRRAAAPREGCYLLGKAQTRDDWFLFILGFFEWGMLSIFYFVPDVGYSLILNFFYEFVFGFKDGFRFGVR